MGRFPSPASEFPNDNPRLHGGAIWVCLAPTSVPTAELPPLAAPEIFVADPSDDDPIVIEDLDPIEASVEGSTPEAPELAPSELALAELAAEQEPVPASRTFTIAPPAPDPFATFLTTLSAVAEQAGAPDLAARIPSLFEPESPLAETDPSFPATAAAWRDILRGASDDFSACGPAMLDEWASALLARLLEAPARAPMLRQELRSRGVAAFGLAA